MTFVLAHSSFGSRSAPPERTLLILHGILGWRRNWAGFARRLARALPEWRIVAADLRGHGESHGAPPPHTLESCASDVERLGAALGGMPAAVAGHSFGGRVALARLARGGAAPRRVFVLDTPPGPWARGEERPRDALVSRVLEAVLALPMPARSRRELEASLAALGLPPAVVAWLGSGVAPVEGGVAWRFDRGVVEALLEADRRADYWPVVESPPPGVRLTLVRAGRSAFWTSEAVARLERAARHPRVTLVTIAEAGHWLHVDAPERLCRVFVEQLRARCPAGAQEDE